MKMIDPSVDAITGEEFEKLTKANASRSSDEYFFLEAPAIIPSYSGTRHRQDQAKKPMIDAKIEKFRKVGNSEGVYELDLYKTIDAGSAEKERKEKQVIDDLDKPISIEEFLKIRDAIQKNEKNDTNQAAPARPRDDIETFRTANSDALKATEKIEKDHKPKNAGEGESKDPRKKTVNTQHINMFDDALYKKQIIKGQLETSPREEKISEEALQRLRASASGGKGRTTNWVSNQELPENSFSAQLSKAVSDEENRKKESGFRKWLKIMSSGIRKVNETERKAAKEAKKQKNLAKIKANVNKAAAGQPAEKEKKQSTFSKWLDIMSSGIVRNNVEESKAKAIDSVSVAKESAPSVSEPSPAAPEILPSKSLSSGKDAKKAKIDLYYATEFRNKIVARINAIATARKKLNSVAAQVDNSTLQMAQKSLDSLESFLNVIKTDVSDVQRFAEKIVGSDRETFLTLKEAILNADAKLFRNIERLVYKMKNSLLARLGYEKDVAKVESQTSAIAGTFGPEWKRFMSRFD